ncbi:TetR/AcrR family transcriptional regulator [Nesterenkonia haasae]|uniref:TetR/AcrR family transcriptional regulator n=1 Tax=Nesterenkonia haasae TaxID=2587813 RepID=UPI001391FAC7|nr:TetR/AcrR family transcriptional regulator [Nesterenkonia haasae]
MSANKNQERPQRRPKATTRKRRDEVLATATRLFHEKGYDATSIQDISDELGLLKGSLYYYISTKEDLLFEIIQSYHEETRAYFDDIVQSTLPVVDKLRTFIETETAHTAHHLAKSSLFAREWRSLTAEHREVIVAERDRHDAFVRECIIAGQESGEFRSSLDPRLAAFGILGMVTSVYRWYREDGPSSAEEVGQAFAEMLISGLRHHPA